jgi:tetratricopeptide (TPR) repeat protein
MRLLSSATIALVVCHCIGCEQSAPLHTGRPIELEVEPAPLNLAPFGDANLARPRMDDPDASRRPSDADEAVTLTAPDLAAFTAGPSLALADAARLASLPKAPSTFEQTLKNDDGMTQEAIRLFQAGKIDEAVATAQQATARNPDNPGAYELLAICFANKGQLARAIPNYDAAIRLQPNNSGYYTQRGSLHLRHHAPLKAQADFDQAISLRDDDPVPFVWRSILYFNMGKLEKALADSGKALKLNDKIPDAYFIRCLALLQSGRRDEAREAYEAAVERGLDEGSKAMVRPVFERK